MNRVTHRSEKREQAEAEGKINPDPSRMTEQEDIGPPRPPPEVEEEGGDIGPPRPSAEDDAAAADDDEDDAGPSVALPPKPRKRKVRACAELTRATIVPCLLRL